MASSSQENRPLLTAPDTNSTDPEQARSSGAHPNDHPRHDEREENDGLTASGHHIDDAHQQTT